MGQLGTQQGEPLINVARTRARRQFIMLCNNKITKGKLSEVEKPSLLRLMKPAPESDSAAAGAPAQGESKPKDAEWETHPVGEGGQTPPIVGIGIHRRRRQSSK
ncbi:MAG: hypothetical protein LQ346_001652 [Caloplaca aetnensis]|nr:MAG: hypothetical protein LQ346_001652 [Caloplaca aetnensis]